MGIGNWTPIFSKLVDSSVWDEPYSVRVLWMTMLALKDRDHVVRCNEYALHKRGSMPMEDVEAGLRVLESPDKRRPDQEYGGRRIQRVEDGWLILNGEVYQGAMRVAAERARKAAWARKNRKTRNCPTLAEREYVKAVEGGKV